MAVVFFIHGEITKETHKEFAELIYSCEDDIQIFLDSGGGIYPYMRAILELINLPENTSRVSITAINHIYSAAFELFIAAKCKKVVISPLHGSFHIIRWGGTVLENGKAVKDEEDMSLLKNYKEIRHFSQKIIDAAGFTVKQTRDFWNGKNFYFTTAEINKLIENYEH